MLLTVDPDLLVATEDDPLCNLVIADLVVNIVEQDIWVGVDEGVIEEEYARLFAQYVRSKQETKNTAKFLDHALKARKKPISAIPSTRVATFLENTSGCSSPVEPEMIAMVGNEPELALLLVGEVPHLTYLRPRGLINANVRHKLSTCLGRQPDIKFAVDSDFRNVIFQELPPKGWRDKPFEDRVAIKLQTQEPGLVFCDAPGEIRNRRGRKVEIDIYGYRHGNDLSLFVGECKFPAAGNEDKRAIGTDTIRQLLSNSIAAAAYECTRPCEPSRRATKLEAAIISTTDKFWDSEDRLVLEVQDHLNRQYRAASPADQLLAEFTLRFMRAQLKRKWMREKEIKILKIITWRTWILRYDPQATDDLVWHIDVCDTNPKAGT
jgi:hypothetical protein